MIIIGNGLEGSVLQRLNTLTLPRESAWTLLGEERISPRLTCFVLDFQTISFVRLRKISICSQNNTEQWIDMRTRRLEHGTCQLYEIDKFSESMGFAAKFLTVL